MYYNTGMWSTRHVKHNMDYITMVLNTWAGNYRMCYNAGMWSTRRVEHNMCYILMMLKKEGHDEEDEKEST